MTKETTKDKNDYETLFLKSVNGLFKASLAVNLRKQDPYITMHLTIFGGKLFSYESNKKGMNIILKPKTVKKLIKYLKEANELHWEELKKLGYKLKED